MSLAFRKRLIHPAAYEAASVFDVDGDGHLDIVSGEYWYEGPSFTRRHKICDVMPVGEYYDDFSDYPLDVNGDGRLDIVTGGWWGETLRWRENPGGRGPWKVHDIEKVGNIETIRVFDLDGCGVPEIFPNTPGRPQCFFKLVVDGDGRGTGRFTRHVIGTEPSGHGLGFGDVDGDGCVDVLLAGGWLENPGDPFRGPWPFHAEFDLGSASVPILGHDVTGNGKLDLIVGQAHDYGLAWYEQERSGPSRRWVKHEIDAQRSQYHDLQLADLDRDGELELVTGKRYRAHCGNDPGAGDPIGIYYFKINRGAFERVVIDHGPAGEASGCGIYFWIEDIGDNGFPDIVAPGKDGLYLFENLGPSSF